MPSGPGSADSSLHDARSGTEATPVCDDVFEAVTGLLALGNRQPSPCEPHCKAGPPYLAAAASPCKQSPSPGLPPVHTDARVRQSTCSAATAVLPGVEGPQSSPHEAMTGACSPSAQMQVVQSADSEGRPFGVQLDARTGSAVQEQADRLGVNWPRALAQLSPQQPQPPWLCNLRSAVQQLGTSGKLHNWVAELQARSPPPKPQPVSCEPSLQDAHYPLGMPRPLSSASRHGTPASVQDSKGAAPKPEMPTQASPVRAPSRLIAPAGAAASQSILEPLLLQWQESHRQQQDAQGTYAGLLHALQPLSVQDHQSRDPTHVLHAPAPCPVHEGSQWGSLEGSSTRSTPPRRTVVLLPTAPPYLPGTPIPECCDALQQGPVDEVHALHGRLPLPDPYAAEHTPLPQVLDPMSRQPVFPPGFLLHPLPPPNPLYSPGRYGGTRPREDASSFHQQPLKAQRTVLHSRPSSHTGHRFLQREQPFDDDEGGHDDAEGGYSDGEFEKGVPEEVVLRRIQWYTFTRLSSVFHLPQDKACKKLQAAVAEDGLDPYQYSYKLSSFKKVVSRMLKGRWPYRKVKEYTDKLAQGFKVILGAGEQDSNGRALVPSRTQLAALRKHYMSLCGVYRVQRLVDVPPDPDGVTHSAVHMLLREYPDLVALVDTSQ